MGSNPLKPKNILCQWWVCLMLVIFVSVLKKLFPYKHFLIWLDSQYFKVSLTCIWVSNSCKKCGVFVVSLSQRPKASTHIWVTCEVICAVTVSCQCAVFIQCLCLENSCHDNKLICSRNHTGWWVSDGLSQRERESAHFNIVTLWDSLCLNLLYVVIMLRRLWMQSYDCH